MDKKKLKEVFRLAGRVLRVDLSIDKDGRSRGFAIVEYDHPVESVQAISMFHNQQLFDRVMTVRMDRANETLKLPEGLKGVGMGLGINGEPLKDVARNLPSTTNTVTATSATNAGAGILGAVPAPALQMGISNALSGLNSVVGSSGLGGLGATSAAVLQAANLAGMGGLQSNLLAAGGLSSNDLSVASGLLNNGLVQNQSLSALTSGTGLGTNTGMQNTFSRNDGGGGFVSQNSSQGYGSGNRMFQSSMDNAKNNFGGYSAGSRSTSDGFSSLGNSGSMLRPTSGSTGNKSGGNYSNNKILINNVSLQQFWQNKDMGLWEKKIHVFVSYLGFNVVILQLPPTASYKMLSEKCNEFGDVQHVEEKGSGSVLVVYNTSWEAENALSILSF